MSQFSYQSFSNPRARRGRDRPSASHLVLNDSKLLAHILSFLDIRSLLISGQRMCKTWHEAIAKTPALQEALFFKTPTSTATRLLNPLLRELWPLWFKSPSSFNKKRPRPKAADFRFLKWTQRPSAFRRPNASWRRMLVISGGTPVTALKVTLFTQSWLGAQESQGVFLCPDGLRMGALWDLTKDWCMFDEEATFMMNWDEDLFSGGGARAPGVQFNPKPVDGGRWKHKLRKIFPGKETKKGFADVSLKSASSASSRSVYAYSENGSLDGVEDRSVEMILSYSVDNQDPDFTGPPALGLEFQSEAYEKVSISYGKSVPI
ncbi:hypothetical protein N431DRAFT_431451 [Stipitochalara longipes BDJ]|nr:hypothetical protein N431DRAFT_431451 [Stipitochalara longipes BDJ]